MIFAILLLLFILVPILEIRVLFTVASQISWPATIAVVAFTGIAGAALARMQGFRVLRQVQESLGQGRMPTDELIEGAIVLFGGVLLLTPGILTDAFGLSCLLPTIRTGYAAMLKSWAKQRITRVGPGRADAGGFRMWVGGVQPGSAAKRSRFDSFEPPPTGPVKTIDATFSVVGEDGSEEDSEG